MKWIVLGWQYILPDKVNYFTILLAVFTILFGTRSLIQMRGMKVLLPP